MRSSLALIATAGLVAVALTGCAQTPAPEAASGGSSDVIEVSGDFGKTPRVDFPTPVSPEETQCTEIIAGEGDRVVAGQQTLVGYAVYNGATGDKIQATGFGDEDPVPLLVSDKTLPGLAKGLTCAREGSRVAVVVPPADAFGDEGNAALGVDGDTSLVFVVDVQRTFPLRADGAPRLTRDGFPAVVLAPDGRPGITVPKAEPSGQTEVEVLREGSGEVVESGDQVVVHYTGVLWEDGTVFDSSWEKGGPTSFIVADGEGSQVVPGFSKAIIGQKVGSQVGVIVAPEDGYGADGNGSTIRGDATLFFVIDILGVL
ncbi:FKBP-type peptidyl-prolyl cis-trans isomerase [Agromyces sp. G08B096]|uniref:Peptidyl-prolyl cis-trans isomerase n=1 Tax=Agromyces sp. G08B096 TaxID=3156399 RepID=A0AAU7WAJ7_9MICO